MKFQYDKKVDALYIRFNDKPYYESDEVRDGVIFDYNKNGKIIGIEVLDASNRFPREFQTSLQKKEISVSLA